MLAKSLYQNRPGHKRFLSFLASSLFGVEAAQAGIFSVSLASPETGSSWIFFWPLYSLMPVSIITLPISVWVWELTVIALTTGLSIIKLSSSSVFFPLKSLCLCKPVNK